MNQTIGQYRVGIDFNPSGNKDVGALKDKAAAFIDECERQRQERFNATDKYDAGTWDEVSYLYDRAMRQCEEAAMNAVKASTKRERT